MLQPVVALVNGGASGLGRAAAEHLAKQGARVLISDLPASKGEEVAEAIGIQARFIAADCTDEAQVCRALDGVEAAFGEPINAAVNCAGVLCAARVLSRKLAPHPLADFERTLRVNVLGTFNVTRLAAERMARREAGDDGARGVIVNTASIAAFEGQSGQTAYSASKGAIVSMTLPLARDLAAFGVRVCTVAPGVFDTPMIDGASAPVRDALNAQMLFPRRLGRSAEFGMVVEAIIRNPYLNGEVIRLDGGVRLPPA